MILETGDMWNVLIKTDLFLITANSTVTASGKLVMGKGLARQARDRIPGLDLACGRLIGHRVQYSLIILPDPFWPLGLFQVKLHWSEPARISLIEASTVCLKDYLERDERGKCLKKVVLNFPGIGNGQLERADVLPIISILPDIVHIWERE